MAEDYVLRMGWCRERLMASMAVCSAVFFCGGTLLGWSMFDYGGNMYWLALGPVVVCLWAAADRRALAWLVMFGYYLGAGRGLFDGGGMFFAQEGVFSVWDGAMVWIAPAVVLSGVWALLWGRSGRWWRAGLAVVVVAVPPVGIIGWGSPLLAAGVWFPGLGVVGLVLMLAVLGLAAEVGGGARSTRVWWNAEGMVGMAVVCNLLFVVPVIDGWVGVNTAFGDGRKQTSFEGVSRLQDGLVAQQAKVAVWPEAAGGWWDVNEGFLADASDGLKVSRQSALIGAHRVVDGRFVNVVESVGLDAGVEWRSRMVVPMSMWRPWASKGERWTADWVGTGVKRFRGESVGVLICYEQVIFWPAVLTMFGEPTVLVGVSNGWWSKGSAVDGAMMASLRSWARLMGVRMIEARNE